jgi:hypothetical protein
MIDITRIALPKDCLRAMPKEERALFFLLGYAANQINLFSRLVIFSTNKIPTDSVEQRVYSAQTQMLARISIGILDETWKLIGKRFLATPIGREFVPKLHPVGQHALAELKTHFGGSNLLSNLRNQFAFHHPFDTDMDAGFEAAVGDKDLDDGWNWYFTPASINSLFFASEFVILHGILNAIGETDLIKAQHRIMNEVKNVNEHMVVFVHSLSEAFLLKYVGPELTAEVVKKIVDAPNVFDVQLPYYVEIPLALRHVG